MNIDFTALVWFAVMALIFLAALWAAERWMDRSIDQRPRAYTGPVDPDADDWFEPVADYFGQRRDSAERVARAVDRTVYPTKKRSRVASTTGSTTKGNQSNGTTEQ